MTPAEKALVLEAAVEFLGGFLLLAGRGVVLIGGDCNCEAG
jgi:hypothetical protein